MYKASFCHYPGSINVQQSLIALSPKLHSFRAYWGVYYTCKALTALPTAQTALNKSSPNSGLPQLTATRVLIAASFLHVYLILPRSHIEIQDSDLEVNAYMKHGNFPHSSVDKDSICNAGDSTSIPGWGRSPGEGTGYPLQYSWASLVAQLVKNPPAMWETWVWSLGWEDPLEKGKATHSSILAWRIPWTV